MVTVSAPLPVFLLLGGAVALLTWGVISLARDWDERLRTFRADRTLHTRARSRIDRFAPHAAPAFAVEPPVPIRPDDAGELEDAEVTGDAAALGPRALRDRVAADIARHPEWSGEKVWMAAVRAGLWPMDGSYHQHIERNRARAYRLRKRGRALLGIPEASDEQRRSA